MADLILPHGGLTEPVCRTVSSDETASFLAEAAALPKVPVSSADLSSVYRFGDGTLSPLTGPMNSATYNRVLDESVIEHNGKHFRLDNSDLVPDHGRFGKDDQGGTEGCSDESSGRSGRNA